MTKKTLNQRPITLNYDAYENPHKETLLLLHCSGGNKHQWDAIIPYFKEDYHLIIPDLRGHGQSDKPDTGFTLEAMAHDIKALLDEKNLKHVHVIGSSLGSEIGVVLAAKYPKVIKSIVAEGAIINNFGPLGYYSDLSEDEVQTLKEKTLKERKAVKDPEFDTKEAMIDAYKNNYEANHLSWNAYRERYVLANIKKADNKDVYTKQCPTRVGYELIRDYFNHYFETWMAEVTCPVLFMPSEDEMNEPSTVKMLDTFKTLLTTYDIQVLKGSNHAETMFDLPEHFSQTIKSFYKTI